MIPLVHRETNSLVIHSDDPLSLRDVLSKSRTLPHPDYNFAVEHTLEATKVLRNMGYEVPAPIRHQYDWPGRYTPFDHQYTMSEFLTLHRRAFNLSEMGTAKTNSALWAADWLMKTGRVRKVLILTPISTMDRVWRTDIFDTLTHRTVALLRGSRDRRLAHLAADADFYILNHDGITIKPMLEELLKRPDIDLIIVDEAGMFRNSATGKYKALEKLTRDHNKRLWLLTGTPCPNAPTDAWALAKLVSPERVPKFFGAFKRQTMMQITNFKWVPVANAFDKAFAAMQPAVRFKKKDCIDLPPVTTQDHGCALSPEQTAMFKALKATMVAQSQTSTITAANAADQIGKLRQILCGAIKAPDGTYEVIPHGPRLQATLDAIESASAKVIVICPFKGILYALQKEIEPHHTCEIINGDVKPHERDRIIKAFKESPDPRILLCHPKVMAHGLNLTEADTLIFYAPIYSNDEVEQVNERFNRAGQTRKMTIIRIGAHPLEWQIYKATDVKAQQQSSILDLYKVVTDEPVKAPDAA